MQYRTRKRLEEAARTVREASLNYTSSLDESNVVYCAECTKTAGCPCITIGKKNFSRFV